MPQTPFRAALASRCKGEADNETRRRLPYAAVKRAFADPHSVPADKFVRIRALAAIGEKERAVAELQQLKPEYEGTLGFAEAVAELKRLGVAIG